MLYKKDVNETRRRELISAAIKVIAENGLENTATNMICAESGINVAYIYRFFESKEDLIAKSFEYVDDEFLGEAMKQLNNPRAGNDEIAERNFKLIFSVIRAYIKSEKINSSDVEGDGNEK